MKPKGLLFLSLFLVSTILAAQEKKQVKATYLETPLTLDARLDEPVYQRSEPARDFVQLQPQNGKPAFQPSEVHLFYDEKAIYVGAMLYDSAPDSIFNYFSERDNIGMSDYFGIYFDPYNQGQLAFGFFITPAGVQTDLKAVKTSYDYEDSNWNAVWQSATRITDQGWTIEMRIPFSALRFSGRTAQNWGLNMFRNIRRYNSNNSWNFIDRKVDGFIHQEGELTGLKNISPPVRFSFSPYAATYLEFKDGASSPEFIYKAGVDLKYGISESFTLDMMLVPDFGQVQSDNKQLNLTPYELYYNERRQFFTEGTELFNRGEIFYSRRIGASPKFAGKAEEALRPNEMIDFDPTETRLVNASKISGRSSDGWGLGLLNAMSLPAYATLKDTLSNQKRKVQTQPFTNYNVSVVDKSLKNNSYISLINSNVTMIDHPFSANVTATEFQFRDKSKKYSLSGNGGFSHRGESQKETGYRAELELEKNSGNLQFGISQEIISDTFNPNDLGFLRRNNEISTEGYIFYQMIEPTGIFREWNAVYWIEHVRMYSPNDVFGTEMELEAYARFKNNYSANIEIGHGGRKHDYDETRVKNRYYSQPSFYYGNIYLNSDSRKRMNFYLYAATGKHPNTDHYSYWGDAGFNLRIGQRLQGYYNFSFNNEYNDQAYADKTADEDSIFFVNRDSRFIENVVGLSYGFSNKATVNIRGRHYWSGADNSQAYLLEQNGSLSPTGNYNSIDQNYNAFNIDLVFRWIFAPGSELSIAWKNAIYHEEETWKNDYWQNLRNTWNSPQTNSLSLKVLYYIDYNNLVRKKGPEGR
ncbi:MAG: DUF5916 domain-containing protein [Mangrovibacterium sp.]